MNLANYDFIETISESARSVVRRARRRSDGETVIIKTPAQAYASAESISRYRNEYVLCSMVDAASVVQVYELIDDAAGVALVTCNYPAFDSLAERGRTHRFDVRESLTIALGIVDALAAIHTKNIVHKDVKPDNVLVDGSLARTVLIDFGIASVVPRDINALAVNRQLEGTLGFMAPEQTGRINRRIDYRSDLHGFGATLYWMLAGRRPFAELSDHAALVHAHIARVPALLSDQHEHVPPVLARIVAKLLSKDPDERYRGTFGLRLDLERCLASLEAGRIPDFELGSIDPAEHLQFGKRLYGRERELTELNRLLEQPPGPDERPRLAVLTGPGGSGKSAMVAAFQDAVVEAGVVFAAGKFDQFSRGTPYAALSQALRTLFDTLAEQNADGDTVLERVREALGPNGALLVELVPEIVERLGTQPPVPATGPGEARDRFRYTLSRFADALFMRNRDTVLFIDDLQWADPPSLRLIQALCSARAPRLTIVLAARQDELGADHPFEQLLAELGEAGVAYRRIELLPLTLADIEALLDDALDGARESAAFAELILRRTGGVPLYVSQLLLSLYHEGIVDIERSAGRWRVDLERANSRASSGDIVEFLAGSLRELGDAAKQVLGVAACIGNPFGLATLTAACDASLAEITWVVLAAVASGHLLPIDAGLANKPNKGSAATSTVSSARSYAFAHDRIQQLALEALPGDRQQLHLRIARRLVEHDERGEHLHAIAGHIAAAIDLISDARERARFAQLCEQAGESAKTSTAYEAAARHYANALTLLEHADGDEPSRRFELTLELGECRFMAGQRELAEQTFARARELAVSRFDRLRLLARETVLALLPGEFERALQILMQVVELYELDVRRGGTQEWIVGKLGGVLGQLGGRTAADVPTMPLLTDPEQSLLLLELYVCSNAAYFDGDMNLYTAIGLTIVELALVHGLSDVSAVGFIQTTLVSSAVGQYELARNLSQIASAIFERFPESVLRWVAVLTYAPAAQTYLEPIHSAVDSLEAARVGLRNGGMLSAAGYAANLIPMIIWSSGTPLRGLVSSGARAREYIAGLGDLAFARASQTYMTIGERLGNPSTTAADLQVPEQPAGLAINPTAEFVIHAAMSMAFVFLRSPARAHQMSVALEPYRAAGTGMHLTAVYDVFALLHACERYPSMREREREQLELRMPEALAGLERWQQSCPENARALTQLLRGAWLRARGEHEQAQQAFTAAADAAADDDYPHFEALANELAAELLLERGQLRYAIGYLEHAASAYLRWGARACERRVSERLRELVPGREPSVERTSSRSTTDSTHDLDIASLIKMSQAMSESTRFEDVAERLLTLAGQNGGADRCVLLLDRDGSLEVHAELRADAEVRVFDPPVPLVQAEQLLALPIIHAAARSDEVLLVSDASRDSRCRRDPYTLSERLRSLCVVPIIKRGRRVGLLVLENRVMTGAFSREHVDVLSILGSQAAITLDNARLFDALRESEEQWRSLVNSAPDSIMIVDREHRIEFANDRGIDTRGVRGTKLEEHVLAADRERVALAIDFVFHTGGTTAYDASIATPDGRRSVTTRLGPIVLDGVVERVTLISTDVTERRLLEEQLRQAQKMQAVGTLAGGVAHDFNNLLTIILGSCELAELEVDEHHPVRELLGEIGAASQRASELTGQLLAFSRKQVLQPRLLDLRTRVEHAAKMLSRLIGENIHCELRLASEPCLVRVDPGQIEQVLVNLAVNARDAMSDGGTLTISVSGAEHSRVLLEVADTGVGMPPELLERVFEPFFTTKPSGKGTGLGLSTVLGIVEQSGGRIELDSRVGQGTRIRAYLPRIIGEALDESSPVASAELPRGDELVLVVEDEYALRTLVSRLLTMQGYRVLDAADGEQALGLARSHSHIDLVITDVVMPGANGLEVVRAVQQLHPRVRALYTSGYTDDAIMRHGVLDGTTAFLQKPFTREPLLFEVRRVLDE